MLKISPYLMFAALAVGCSSALAQAPVGAATPPMGWNSWNFYASKVDDKAIRDTADIMVSSGMRDAGYVYLNIDDTWEGDRDASGVLHTNSKFPDMKALADYVHSKGLKLGIYSSPGAKTCARFEGSYGHEDQDAKLYAEWGIDYLKYDLCSFREIMNQQAPNDPAKQNQMMRDAYEKMHQAILKTGRPMIYSLCQYGFDDVWQWGPKVGANLWRTTGDINASYDRMILIGFGQAGLAKYAGPDKNGGHWNDPDMLEVGNGIGKRMLSHDENVTHMTLWALLAAPLLAGNDLHVMTADTSAILTNREVIAIDQDPLGKQGDRVFQEGPVEMWSRELKGGKVALAIFNAGESATSLEGIKLPLGKLGFAQGATARDVWQAKSLGTIHDDYRMTIPRHGCVLLVLTH